MKVKIPSPKSEFVKRAFVILVTGILPFSLIVNKAKIKIKSEDYSPHNIIRYSVIWHKKRKVVL